MTASSDDPGRPADDNAPPARPAGECSDEPKLTADEWAYVQAVTTEDDA